MARYGLSLSLIEIAPSGIICGPVRVESNGGVEIGDGADVIVLMSIGKTAVDISSSIFRIERNRAVEIRDGSVVVALHPIGFAAIGEKTGSSWARA
jgi:hypothetical protein